MLEQSKEEEINIAEINILAFPTHFQQGSLSAFLSAEQKIGHFARP